MQSPENDTYLFSYRYRGATWGFDVKAASPEDAKRRVSEMVNARYDGVLVASVPLPPFSFGAIGRALRRFIGLDASRASG